MRKSVKAVPAEIKKPNIKYQHISNLLEEKKYIYLKGRVISYNGDFIVIEDGTGKMKCEFRLSGMFVKGEKPRLAVMDHVTVFGNFTYDEDDEPVFYIFDCKKEN